MDEPDRKLTIRDETSEFLLYSTDAGTVRVEVLLGEETIWLTQPRMAVLFNVQIPAISKHLKNIYASGELTRDATVSILETVQIEGEREVTRPLEYYNLDAIISVGYRVNSPQATRFRIWATKLLREYLIKGFILDDERLKNGRFFGKDYFRELLERVRSIRASERRIYQQITDIFAECSIDYDPKSETTRNFYAHVQDKFHFAITGKTSAEIIHLSADASLPNMGLKTFKHAPDGRILKSDALIGKNYLAEAEIKKLERTVSAFFDYIEGIIERRQTFTMEAFSESVNKFLTFNEYQVLEDVGCVKRTDAEAKASAEYEKFNRTRKTESDFDKSIKKLVQRSKRPRD